MYFRPQKEILLIELVSNNFWLSPTEASSPILLLCADYAGSLRREVYLLRPILQEKQNQCFLDPTCIQSWKTGKFTNNSSKAFMKYGNSWKVHSKNGTKNRKEIKVKYFIKSLFLGSKMHLIYFVLLILGCNSDVCSHLMYHSFFFF